MDDYQNKFRDRIKLINEDLIHIDDGGIIKKYIQNPPYQLYLYGCPVCGGYFESNHKLAACD